MTAQSQTRGSSHAPRGDGSDAIRIDSFAGAREVLRSGDVRQAGFNAELVHRFIGPRHPPVLHEDGAAQQEQRSAPARVFTPRVVATRYCALMEASSRDLVERF